VRPQLEFFRTTVFRWTLAFAAVFVSGVLLLFLFIYWQSAGYLTRRVDAALIAETRSFAAEPPPDVIPRIERSLNSDPRRPRISALFSATGEHLSGNLHTLPPDLPSIGMVGDVDILTNNLRKGRQSIRATSVRLPDGNLLVLGRDVEDAREISDIVSRALVLGTIPAVLLALLGGALLSRSTVKRIEDIHHTTKLIMAGDLKQRLPIRRRHDDFDKLAIVVNGMLDEIERLVIDAKGVGDDIAHDLRTPLTRLRARLEHATLDPATGLGVRDALHASIGELDSLLETIAALLRITEIEHGQRRAAFRSVDIVEIAREVAELYEPAAEDRGLMFTSRFNTVPNVYGDRDLLFEALTNLLDNAVKFTPSGGRVAVAVLAGSNGTIVRVEDSGTGISEAERETVFRRFYRSDRSRQAPGTGLGLSLVAAIVRLHGFHLSLSSRNPGCRFDLECWTHHDADDEGPTSYPSKPISGRALKERQSAEGMPLP
jgi:signal transduction histidine kinase